MQNTQLSLLYCRSRQQGLKLAQQEMLLQTLYFSVNYKDTEFLFDMSSVFVFFFNIFGNVQYLHKAKKTSHTFFLPFVCYITGMIMQTITFSYIQNKHYMFIIYSHSHFKVKESKIAHFLTKGYF